MFPKRYCHLLFSRFTFNCLIFRCSLEGFCLFLSLSFVDIGLTISSKIGQLVPSYQTSLMTSGSIALVREALPYKSVKFSMTRNTLRKVGAYEKCLSLISMSFLRFVVFFALSICFKIQYSTCFKIRCFKIQYSTHCQNASRRHSGCGNYES